MKLTKLAVAIGVLALNHHVYGESTKLEKTVLEEEEVSSVRAERLDSIDIEQKGLNTGLDIVRHIPGVQINDSGDRFNDNGFNIRGVKGDDISITVDGLEQGETLSPPTFRPYGMFGANRGIVDLETVKSIEIVKGPNSVLAGSGALGGSVALTTKDPQDYLDAEDAIGGAVKLGYDDRSDESLVSTAIAGRAGVAEALLMVVRRDGSEVEAFGDGADILGAERGEADPFDRDNTSVLAKLNIQLSEAQRFSVVFEDSQRDSSGRPLSRDSATYYDFATEDESTRKRYGLAYTLSDLDGLLFDDLSINADIQDIFNSGVTAFSFNSGAGLPDESDDFLRVEDRSYQQDTLDIGVDFQKTFGEYNEHDLVYGLAYRTSSVENELYDRRYTSVSPNSEQTQNVRDPSWVPDTDKQQYTVYVLDTYRATERVTLSAGLRYENASYDPVVDENFVDPTGLSVDESKFSGVAGQLSVNYEFIDNHSVGLLFAQGYKAPTTQELYLDVSAIEGGFVDAISGAVFDDWEAVTNPDLDAETSQSIELSYRWETDDHAISVNVFSTEYRDRIENIEFARDFGQTVEVVQPCSPNLGCDPSNPPANEVYTQDVYLQAQNTGKQRVDGIELQSHFSLRDNVVLLLSYSHLEGEHKSTLSGAYNDGDDMLDISPDSAVVGISYLGENARWGLNSSLVWTDEKSASSDLSFVSVNNGSGPVMFPDASVVLDLSAYYNVTDSILLSANIYNLTDEKYTRWEVINGVREGDGGFFSGVRADGVDRFTEPGRSFSIRASYAF